MHEIKVTQTDKGSHGFHWYSVFDQDILPLTIQDRVIKAIETGKKIMINDLSIITDPVIRSVIHNNYVITGFPYLKGVKYEQFQVASIAEWSHVDNLEAIIKVGHTSKCAINFFATDYVINKDIYKAHKELSINIVGLVYDMNEFNAQGEPASNGLTLGEDFCGYFPRGEDEIQFIGRIQHMHEYLLGEIAGYLITVGITPDFSMEFFVSQNRLSIELTQNKHVSGVAWIQGTLEK